MAEELRETDSQTQYWLDTDFEFRNNSARRIAFCDGTIPTPAVMKDLNPDTDIDAAQVFGWNGFTGNNDISAYSGTTMTIDFNSLGFTNANKTSTVTWFYMGDNINGPMANTRSGIWGTVGLPGSGADIELETTSYTVGQSINIADTIDLVFNNTWTWG